MSQSIGNNGPIKVPGTLIKLSIYSLIKKAQYRKENGPGLSHKFH